MPRQPRKKSMDSIYHIMVKSISETSLFKDEEDKVKYLKYIVKYQKIYNFKVYAYCLMSNHAHFIIDSNGADISRIMHNINFSYAISYNKKYKRLGPLFYDRFKSKIVDNERYIMTLSAYIHNNPTDIKGFEKCPEKYEFSTLSVYLGNKHDPYGIVDEGFIMQLFGNTKSSARKGYSKLVAMCNKKSEKDSVEFKDEKTEYRSERKILVKNYKIDDIINYIARETGLKPDKMHTKYSKDIVEAKAIAAMLMRHLCNYRCKEICAVFGNITESRVSKLCNIGLEIIDKNDKYPDIISRFIKTFAA